MTPDPALLVAVPLVASVLPAATDYADRDLARPVTLAALVVHAAVVTLVVAPALAGRPVTTTVGGLPADYGIRLVVDAVAAPFVALAATAGLGAVVATHHRDDRAGAFHALVLLLVAGITGVCVTADAFNLYVFLEITGLAAYALVARAPGGDAALAALKYLLVGTVGATLYLLGVAYAYVATGTLDFAGLAAAFAARGLDDTLVLAAFALVTVGLAVKMALFPVHVWKPDAYATAPPGVAALLAALVSTAAGYALLRLLLAAFTVDLLAETPVVRVALLTAGTVSVLAGSLLAIRAADVRRLLAYSSVAQFGVVTLGVAVATPLAVVGVVVHLVGHAVAKFGFYLLAVALAGRGVVTVDDYAGLGARHPAVAVGVAIFALGLVGIPPTVGFAGKLYVLVAAVDAGAPAVAAVVLLSTLTSLVYFVPLLQRAFVEDAPADARPSESVPTTPLAVAAVAAVVTLALGVGAAAFADLLEPTVRGLFV